MDKNRGQRREVGIIDTPIELITAQEARDMAMHSDVDYIEKAVEKQLSAVNQTIMEAAQCGFYTAYYKSELYPQVESLLKECGYNTEKLYEDHELVGRTPIRIFKGTHISWNWRDNKNATCEDCWRKFFETLIEKGVGLDGKENHIL